MRCFITGGAGFIGSHLSEALLREGHEVSVLDDLSTGSMANLDAIRRHPRFTYRVDSFTNVPLVAEMVDDADVVYHLAAAVGVKMIVRSPVRTIETNVRGTEIVLAAAEKKSRPVVIASTSEVYGKSPDLPFREDGDLLLGATTKGRWSYACSKAIDEFLAHAYWKERELPTIIVRLFNTVGPRQTGRYGMVLPTFVRQAVRGEAITVYGDGNQRRCFAHVADVCGALVHLVRPEAYGEVFNIGSNEEVSILELAHRVRDRAGSESSIVTVPYAEAYEEGFEDMPRRVPCIEKIQRLLDFKLANKLDDIIDDVIAFERARGPEAPRRNVARRRPVPAVPLAAPSGSR